MFFSGIKPESENVNEQFKTFGREFLIEMGGECK